MTNERRNILDEVMSLRARLAETERERDEARDNASLPLLDEHHRNVLTGFAEEATRRMMEERKRAEAAEARVAELEAAVTPFATVADGIPDNWPGEAGLAWDVYDGREPRAEGQEMASVSYKFSALGTLPIHVRGKHPRIEDYRRLRALLAQTSPPCPKCSGVGKVGVPMFPGARGSRIEDCPDCRRPR